jgi:tRNA(fMet)-specific endonuclease VapC
MHIAAHARSEGLVLVTNNMGEFARVPALEAENWVDTALWLTRYRASFAQSD